MARTSAGSPRGGYTLVFVAMLMFAFFGLAALVIDLGMVRLTQLQMQSAADSAALEGLRFRDEIPAAWWAQYASQVEAAVGGGQLDPTNAQDRDTIRRWAASYMVANIFDDDMNPSDVDTSGTQGQPGNWGAGPVLDVTGQGLGSNPALAAGQLLQVPPAGQRAYKPSLQINTANDQYGDLVSGTYGTNGSYGGAYPYEEDSQYNRADFEPATTTTGSESAFLARLRRTNDLQGLDNLSGISSAGPTLPYLFGRGSTIQQQTGSSYSPRQQGVTVRGTGLASVGAMYDQQGELIYPAIAKTVGPPIEFGVELGVDQTHYVTNGVEGLGNVALTQSWWATISRAFTGTSSTDEIYPPVFQVSAIDNQNMTLVLDVAPSYPPVDPGDTSSASSPPQPSDFYVQVDDEIMRVKTIGGGNSWTVVRGASGSTPAAHAANSTARFVGTLYPDSLGNSVDTPQLLSAPFPNPANTNQVVIPMVSAGRFASLAEPSTGGSIFNPSSNGCPFPIWTAAITPANSTATSLSLVVPAGGSASQWQLTTASGTQPNASASLGSPIDVVLTGPVAEGATTATVTMPAYYPASSSSPVPYIADPSTAPGGPFIALMHCLTSAESSPEYVRVTSSLLSSNTKPMPGKSGTPASYTWTITRGLLGTQDTNHGSQSTDMVALTPVAGCWFGTTQLGANSAMGASDPAMTVQSGGGFPLSAVSEPPQTPTPAFCVQVEKEIIGVVPFSDGTSPTPRAWYDSAPPSTWQLLRGLYGTTAASHAANRIVRTRDTAAYGDPIQPAAAVFWGTLPNKNGVDQDSTSISVAVVGTSQNATPPPTTTPVPAIVEGFPPDPNNQPNSQFFVVIDDERLLVQDFDDAIPTTWTVVRSQNGVVQSHSQNAPVAVGGHRFAPLVGDFWNSSFGSNAAAGIAGFGRAIVVPTSATAALTASVSSPPPIFLVAATGGNSAPAGVVARNASPTFLKPFAADLEIAGLQLQLWQQMIGANADSGGDIANPSNPALAPVMMSTNRLPYSP